MYTTDKAAEITNNLVKRFETGDVSSIIDIATIKLNGSNSIPSQKWSFLNQLVAYIQSGGEVDCRGPKQWTEVGRHVTDFTKAVYILAPIFVKKIDDDGKEKSILIGFKSIPVFSYNDTDGKPLPERESMNPDTLPHLYEVAKAWNIPVEYMPIVGAYGSYSPTVKNIRLATHEESVFFHELAHAAHARIETVKGGQDSRQETIAEFTACVLMQVYGLKDTTGNAWEYIKHYNPDNPVQSIMSSLNIINKVLEEILKTAGELQPA